MKFIKELWSDFRDGLGADRAERVARAGAMAEHWRVVVSFTGKLGDYESIYGPVETFDSWTLTPEKRARHAAEQNVKHGVWLMSGELIPPHRIACITVSQVKG